MKQRFKCWIGLHDWDWILKKVHTLGEVAKILYYHHAMEYLHSPMIFNKNDPECKKYIRKEIRILYCKCCKKAQFIVIE